MNYIATIGTFDGVHKGHQFLLNFLRQEAEKRNLLTAAIVIDKPSTNRLTTRAEQDQLINQLGINQILHFDFDSICRLTAVQFLQLLNEQHNVEALLMGYDHRFGADLQDFEHLTKTNAPLTIIKCPMTREVCSSSLIRQALLQGDIDHANQLLGHSYSLTGNVVRGNGIGHTIGFPTANIQPDPHKLIPKSGVYAAQVRNHKAQVGNYKALVNIGTNPTVGNSHITIEAYLIDYKGDSLYNQTLTLSFAHRLRDEIQFHSLTELQQQIQNDLLQCANLATL